MAGRSTEEASQISLTTKLATLVAIALTCATVGIGVGFIQGEIAARRGSQDEHLVFAGTAGLIGGLVALLLGPIIYYALKRRISFEQFCYIAALSLVVGCVAALLLSIQPNGPGWASMFVTPIAAVLLAIGFAGK